MRRLGCALLVVLVLAAAGALATAWRFARGLDLPGPLAADKEIVVERGMGNGAIANRLFQAGAVETPWQIIIASRLTGKINRLKAGEYLIPAHASPTQIVGLLAEGKTITRRVTLPEGRSVAEAIAILAAEPLLAGEIAAPPPEGSLLPESYDFQRGESREAVLARMREAGDKALTAAWGARDPAIEKWLSGPEQLRILASIVEKETAVPAERPVVAAVYLNRLKQGWTLDADPTLIYGATRGAPGAMVGSIAQLKQLPGGYNTYKSKGLPPTAIGNPGKATLVATANPAASDAMFFVADGKGGHVFARTLDEQNRNVDAWLARKRAPAEASPAAKP